MEKPSRSSYEDQFPTENLQTDAVRDNVNKTVIHVQQEEISGGWVSIKTTAPNEEPSTPMRDNKGQIKEHTTETLKKQDVQKGTFETENDISTLPSKVKALEDDLCVMTKERDKCAKEKDALQSRVSETEKQKAALQSQVKHLEDHLKVVTEERNKFAEEKDAFQARLSQVFSVQIGQNNPAIANLSDPLRPTVIAEKYSQLYDNEWTDGYQILSGKTEEESIQTLRDIVKDSYVFCVNQADKQCEKVITSLLLFDSTKKYNKLQVKRVGDLDISQRAALNDLRRKTSILSKETVINEYCEEERNFTETQQALLPFKEKCVELCWYMVLQSPHVYIEDCDKYTKGSDFNKDIFRFYTRTGTKLDFVVWPPLYLHKDGPLLLKGVAEPLCDKKT